MTMVGTNWRTDPDVGRKDLVPMSSMQPDAIAVIKGNIPYDHLNGILVCRHGNEIISIGLETKVWNLYSSLKVKLL